jgi:hypothetical protein
MNVVIPLCEQEPSDEAGRQADQSHVRLPVQVKGTQQADEDKHQPANTQDSVAALGIEQPRQTAPEGDHDRNAVSPRIAIGHFQNRNREASMADSLAEHVEAEQPIVAADGPPFMLLLESGWTDFWAPPKLYDDYRVNVTLGELYCDMAVRHARNRKDPLVLELVVSTIVSKTTRGEIAMGPLELGFFHRLSKLAYVGSLN